MMDLLFIDLDNNWAQACIVELAQQSLVSGYGDDRFRPEANLTRAEFAALMVKAFADADSVRSPVVFADVENTHWAYDAIQTATANGFFSGYPDGRFQHYPVLAARNWQFRQLQTVEKIWILEAIEDDLLNSANAGVQITISLNESLIALGFL